MNNVEENQTDQPHEKSTFLSKIAGLIAAGWGFVATQRRVMNNALMLDRHYVANNPLDGVGAEFKKLRHSVAQNYSTLDNYRELTKVGQDVHNYLGSPTVKPDTPFLDEEVLLGMAAEGKLGLKHLPTATRNKTVAFAAVVSVAAGIAMYQGFKYITKSRFQRDENFEQSFAKVVEMERREEENERERKRGDGAAIA